MAASAGRSGGVGRVKVIGFPVHGAVYVCGEEGRLTPESTVEQLETPLEPEEITSARKMLDQARNLIDSGEVESLSIFLQRRDDTYQTLQSSPPSRLFAAGMLLEMAIARLGFVDRDDVAKMIADAEK